MVESLLKSLNDIQYTGTLKDKNILIETLDSGLKCLEYMDLVTYLTGELRTLCSIDEMVNAVTTLEDSISFLMELSSFLKELGCPHKCLTQGHISDRLNSREDRTLLLDYLLNELMAARILQDGKADNKIELKLQETRQASNLRKILMTLRFPKPPANISVAGLFQKLNPTVQAVVHKAPGDLLGTPICNFSIEDKHWGTLEKVQQDLNKEYAFRREMMLKRLDCTVQSFQWSDKMKNKDELINKSYSEKRKQLKVEPNISIADLLSAREDVAVIEKTSSAAVRKNTQTSINKVIIGQVPDRGGRTNEQAPPPREMPSWSQRQPGPPGGGRGDFKNRGNNRGQRGGGGHNNQRNYQSDQQQGNYYSDGGRTNYDSAGSYASGYGNGNRNQYSNDYQTEPKRPRTYDNYQQNSKTTYADQYVQESQHNQQYHRGRGRGRGYNRGRGGNY